MLYLPHQLCLDPSAAQEKLAVWLVVVEELLQLWNFLPFLCFLGLACFVLFLKKYFNLKVGGGGGALTKLPFPPPPPPHPHPPLLKDYYVDDGSLVSSGSRKCCSCGIVPLLLCFLGFACSLF